MTYLKTMICKKCNASFVPEVDLQKIISLCNVCMKINNKKTYEKLKHNKRII